MTSFRPATRKRIGAAATRHATSAREVPRTARQWGPHPPYLPPNSPHSPTLHSYPQPRCLRGEAHGNGGPVMVATAPLGGAFDRVPRWMPAAACLRSTAAPITEVARSQPLVAA
jgi:hypothetical protein